MNPYIYSLVLDAKEGDPKAFEQLYIQYKDKVYALALATTKSASEAEEATRLTFIQVFRQVGSLQDTNAFDIWLRYIALNESNALRQSNNRYLDENEVSDPHAERIEDDFLMSQDYIERDDLSYRMRMIIDGLPRIRRQTLILSLYDKLSPAEIAQITGGSEDEVISRLRCSKGHIKSELEAREHETGEHFYNTTLVPFDNVYSYLIHSRGMSAESAAKVWEQIQSSLTEENQRSKKRKIPFGIKAAIAASVATIVICMGILGILLAGPTFSAKKANTETIVETTAVTEAPTTAPSTEAPADNDTSSVADVPEEKAPAADPEPAPAEDRSEEQAAPASNDNSELLSTIAGNYYMPQMAGYTHVSLAIENSTVTQRVINATQPMDKSESGEINSVSRVSDTVIRYESSSGAAFSGTYYGADTPLSQVPSSTIEYLSGFNRYDLSGDTLGITIVVDDQNTCFVRNS
ncbi:sigma-70 family RNA polymerase sigma factor [uncultured Ruminococcus sp.]|uniref:sigma-70 family RNA polymerase sigma factor n=1 Tax=uncultured Ruminococcus sp. TaxID=165186 RepID=UPI002931EA1B|nr:sigma-70 family RNA polymerase sigma factor [uncultured Ruminococcus sp.]